MIDCGEYVVVQEVVGGFVVIPEFANQLRHVFSRIIFALRVRLQRKPAPSSPSSVGTSDAQDCSIQQWLNGAKVVRGPLSATITLTDAEGRKDQLTVTCRGPVDHRRQLFFFQVLLFTYLVYRTDITLK